MRPDYKVIEMNMNNKIAVIRMNNPPVNQLSEVLLIELSGAIRSCFEDKAVEALIITGSGKNFIAGADITELRLVKNKEAFIPKVMENHRFLNSIEAGPKPVIAAINGNCLGGGLEFAMACHHRIAVQGANIGLVEVQVGLIPGGGGTQRLPRLVGLPIAVEMITGGLSIKSEKAVKLGLISKVVAPDNLLSAALETASFFIKTSSI
jgi:enoyl-CoA hydratase/carnithine racemase